MRFLRRLLELIGERTLVGTGSTWVASTVSLPAARQQITTRVVTVSGEEEEALLEAAAIPQGQLVQRYIVRQALTSAATAPDPQAMSRFMRIGHSLWAIVLGVLGGLLTRAFYYRRERLAARAATSG